MVVGGTLEVSVTVNSTEYRQSLDVLVTKREWGTVVTLCTDITSLGAEAPQQHSDLGEAEYDILYTPADKLDTATVSDGPNRGMFYLASLNLTAPFIVKINRHFRMAAADLPPTWVAFKNANTRYDEIETKLKARLGFDGTTSRTLYGSWKIEIGYNDPKARLEEFMEVPGDYLSDYKSQIMTYLDYIRTSRKAGMKRSISGWRPSGITINYNYFAAHAGSDQTVSVGSTVNFDGSGSIVPQGREFIYTWAFGDGSTGTEETSGSQETSATGVQATHSYSTTGAKTVTLTVGERGRDPHYTDRIIIDVVRSLKQHHRIPVGMMAIEHEDLSGLKGYFERIYTGESDDTISRYQACNHLHSYGHNFDNSGTPDFWGLNNSTANREQRNAQAWANYVKTVAEANTAVGNGNLKCLISRPLMGLYRHPDPDVEDHWTLEELRSYVHHTIHKIDAIDPSIHPNPRSLVAGWYLSDDGFPDSRSGDFVGYTKDELEQVVCEVHTAQKQCGVKWPFYWADNVDGYAFYDLVRNEDGSHRHDFVVPSKLKDWVGAFPDDATPIFMPYYYPWQSGNWEYTVNPPWKKWRVFMEKLDEAFFGTAATATHPNLKLHPIIEAAQDTYTQEDVDAANTLDSNQTKVIKGEDSDVVPPGHADMHKQIRVVWELLRTYSSVTGIWVLGWNKAVDGSRANAEENWTENRRYAEAFQNEPYATEGIPEAIPHVSRLHPAFTVENKPSKRIPYSLSERKRFEIRIYKGNIDENPNAELVRTLDEGYDGVSPQGAFRNAISNQNPEHLLRGTRAYWDGYHWNSANGMYEEVGAGTYYLYLYLDGTRVDGHQTITIQEEDEPSGDEG